MEISHIILTMGGFQRKKGVQNKGVPNDVSFLRSLILYKVPMIQWMGFGN